MGVIARAYKKKSGENLYTGVAKDVRRKVYSGRYKFKGKIKYKTLTDVANKSKIKAKLKIKKKRRYCGCYLPKRKKSYVTLDMKLHRFDYDNCAHIVESVTFGPQYRNRSWNKLLFSDPTFSIDNNENVAHFNIPNKKYFSVTLDTDDWWEVFFN
ncbi:MAG: hypothetical protein ACPGVE_04295 [Flavobacteriales bacterium]